MPNKLGIALAALVLVFFGTSFTGPVPEAHAAGPVTQLGSELSQLAVSNTLANFMVPAGNDRLLVVVASDAAVSVGNTSISLVTFGATAMTKATEVTDGFFATDSIWYLAMGSGASDTRNVVMTSPGNAERFISAVVFTGVRQTTPVTAGPTFGNPSGSNVGSSVDVPSAPGDMVYDIFDAFKNPNPAAVAAGLGQTVVSDKSGLLAALGAAHYVTSKEAGASPNVTMSWTSDAEAVLHATINIHQAQPDLTITKTHAGSFTQGSTGNNYMVTVTNSGGGDKDAGQAVSVTDTPPSGLTVTAMSGTGWTCTTLPTCTRNDVLLAGASYPPITVTVTVGASATSPQVNSITVTTAQAESNSGNNTATDSTVIVQPDLTIAKSHTGSFTQGSTGNTYAVTVTNSGLGDKSAGQSVSVTDLPPSGLTVTAMSGTGWTCTTLPTCTRNDVLPAGNAYPPITVTVTVGASATSPQVNSITVTTAQAESNSGNNTATDSTVITGALQPDLTIAKSHTGSFTQGSTGNNYTVTVTNSGLGDKNAGQSVSVTDSPPSGLTVTAMSGTGWTCTTLPTCTRNDVLLAGAFYPPITVTVTVGASATSPQVNSITVTTAQAESNSGNNTATDSTVIVQPDLTIAKSHTGSFTQGSTGNNYTVTVTNSGLGDKNAGQSVSVMDSPPSGLTVTAMSGTGWTCTTLPTCTRNDVLLAGAFYPPITVTVTVGASATSPQVNSITVTTAQAESNSGNNTATDSTVITGALQPDLTIAKSHTGSFTQGSAGNTYTVTVTNSGTGAKDAGQSVSVTDAPPSGLTVTAMSGTGWTCTTLPTCTRNDVLPAGNAYPAITVTVTVAASATSPQVNSITVTTAQTESNSGNNTATDSTVITGALQPDLTITKSHTGSFTQGSAGNTYTVTVTNSGTGAKDAGQSVSVTDAPPSGLTVTAMSGTGWTCTTLPTCTRNDVLPAGNAYPAITVTVTVAASATSPQVNSITVTTAQTESNSGNNTATDSTVITGALQPDLTITKSHTGSFTQGSAGNTYTVTVTNSGTGAKDAGQSVSVTDAPPSGLTVTAMSGTGWTCTTLPTCTRSDVLPAAASYPPITVTVTVGASATSPQVNSISVSTAQAESNSGNNTATDSTTVTSAPAGPNLAVTKSHAGVFTQGQVGATYSVVVSNVGLGPTAGLVTMTETPPPGFTITGMSGTGWTCGLTSCTRGDVLGGGSSYPAIIVMGNVSATAVSGTNTVTVSGGGDTNVANNSFGDPTTILEAAGATSNLSVVKSHNGTFIPGQTGATWTVVVTNGGTGPTVGAVTVIDQPGVGVTITSISGTGWTCVQATLTCTRSDVLAAGGSYPVITVVATIAVNATSAPNSVTVSGGGDATPGNNSSSDPGAVQTPFPVVTPIPQIFQNPGALGAIMQGNRPNTPMPSRPVVTGPVVGVPSMPVIQPPRTGNAGMAAKLGVTRLPGLW